MRSGSPDAPALSGRSAGAANPSWRWLLPLALIALLTVAAVLVGNGDLPIALAPCAVALAVWAVWSLPLRVPMLGLLIASWVLEVPGDAFAGGMAKTPWHLYGAILFAKLNLTVPVSALVFSGFDLLVAFLAVVIFYRHATHSRLDRIGWVPSPSPIAQAALLSLAAVAWMAFYGLANGGSFRFTLWQISKHLYAPIIYLLMVEALRGAADVRTIGRIILGAGVFRAGEAILVRRMFPSVSVLPHATTHHDSVLFAICVAILLAMMLERPSRQVVKLWILLLPIYLGGMLANNRRLVWPEVAITAMFFLFITPMGKFKRFLFRTMALAALPLIVYAAAGWNSEGGSLFAPVRTLRSLVDTQNDSSTRWRDWENYNLVTTFKRRPLLGSGFGHPFEESVKLPDVTSVYELEPYIPHNSLLGLWAFGGLIGFALLWVVYPVGLFFTVRAYRCAREPTERIAALGAAAAQICYLIQAYADLGFGTWGPVFSLATSYALVGKICVANGAWPMWRRNEGLSSAVASARSSSGLNF